MTLRQVSHSFAGHQALRELDLDVPRNQITVLLGPNGAGKTTAIRAITGALTPDSGRVRTFGLDPAVDGDRVRPRCGVVSAKPALYDRLSGRENLRFSARLYGMDASSEPRLIAVAERFGIADVLDEMVGGYSTGMKTRLALARAVLHHPELLLFDEPTSGLDPESAHAVLELIGEMTVDGCTVVMCTHLLAEAEGLADHVVIMEGGKALVSGSPQQLTRRYWPHPVVQLGAEDPRLLDRISGLSSVHAYRRTPSGARLEIENLRDLPDIVATLVNDGVRLNGVVPHTPTLEDLYFTIRRGSSRSNNPQSSSPKPLAPIEARWPDKATTTPVRDLNELVS